MKHAKLWKWLTLLCLCLSLCVSTAFVAAAESESTPDASSVLTYKGMSSRKSGDTGLRSTYVLDFTAAKALSDAGYTVEVGAIMGIAKVGGVSFNTLDDLTVKTHTTNGYVAESAMSAAVTVWSSANAGYATNLFNKRDGQTNTGTFTFTTIYSAAYDTKEYFEIEMCYRGFVALTKDGVTTYTYVDATGENFGDEASIYEVVSYFVTGNYDEADADELRALPKFHRIMSTVGFDFDATEFSGTKAAEALQTASDGTNYREFMKGEDTATGGAIKLTTPTYTVPGIYEVEIDYLTNGVAVQSFAFRNDTLKAGNPDVSTTAAAGTATFFGLAAGASTTETIDPTASALKTVKLSSVLVTGENGITGYMTGGCAADVSIAIAGVRLRLVAPFGSDTGATYFNLARNNGTTDVYTTVKANESLAPFSFTVSESGLYRLSGMIGSYNGATWKLEVSDGKDTRTLTQSAAGLHTGYGVSADSVVYANGFGDMYLEEGVTYTATFTSLNLESKVYGFVLSPANREAKESFEYYPKDNEATADDLLSDGETVGVGKIDGTNALTHSFTVTADRAGVYGIRLKYNAKTARVSELYITNNSVSGVKSAVRILAGIADNSTDDYAVPDSRKAEDFYPQKNNAATDTQYGGYFAYVYLKEGANSLTLSTSKDPCGIYGMEFTLLSAVSPSERMIYSEFKYANGSTYDNTLYDSPTTGHSAQAYVTKKITIDQAGLYRLSGFMIGYHKDGVTMLADLTDESGNTITVDGIYWNGSVYSAGSSTSRRYGVLGEDIELMPGTYTLKIYKTPSAAGYVGFSEIHLHMTSLIPTQIDTPAVTIDNDGVATWDAVNGATAYAYKVNGGDTMTTTNTSVTLTSIGDTITVMAIGNGKELLDSEWSDTVTYIITEWEFDLSETSTYTMAGDAAYADGFVTLPKGEGNYLEFTVNAAIAGFYDVSYTGKAVERARIHHVNRSATSDGWSSHRTSAQIAAGTTQSSYTRGTSQYLNAGENTIRIYVFNGSYYASGVKISLVQADTADITHMIVNTKNAVVTKKSSVGDDGFNFNETTGLLSGAISGRKTAVIDFTLPTVNESALYKLYVLGAMSVSSTSTDTTFALSDGATTLSFMPSVSASHYHEGNLYEIGEMNLLAGTEYTLTTTIGASWIGFHRLVLVKVGEYSGEMITLETPNVTISANGVASWEPIAGASGYEYTIGTSAPVVTTETSVVLTAGQSITVKALGTGAYTDSEASESLTYVPAPATEWEFDLSQTSTYTMAGSAAYADGFVTLPKGEGNYLEFTVNAAVAGFYDVSYTGKAVERARIHHVNRSATSDGWSSHRTSLQFAASTTQSSYTRGTSQYLNAGENTIRIYVFNGSYYASGVKISLVQADTADTVHMIVNSSNAIVTKKSSLADDGFSFNETAGLESGAISGRGNAVIDFTLPTVTESGMYTLYAFGANNSTVDTTFDLSNSTTTLSFKPSVSASHYHEGNLYEIGEMLLVAGTEYTLTATIGGSYFGFHRLVLVKAENAPDAFTVPSLTLDAVGHNIDADVLLMGANYNHLTMGAYNANGDLLSATYGSKTENTETFSLSIALSENDASTLSYIRIFPTAAANSNDPIAEDAVYTYTVKNDLTATSYTADKATGEFSVTFDFASFAYQYVTLVVTDANGNTLGTAHTTLPDYETSGTTLSVTLDTATAETVTEMKLVVATEEGGTNAVSGMTGFTYRFVGDLRLLFVSDLHYTPTFGQQSNSINGLPTEKRPQHLVDAILAEHAANGVDAVFLLGDLTSSENYYKLFKEGHALKSNDTTKYDFDHDGDVDMDDYLGSEYDGISTLNDLYLSQLRDAGVPVYCVPGNHDTVDNAYWEKIFGYKATFDYSETEYIVRFPEHKTAVILLNTFDEAKGAQTGSRTNDGTSYLAGTQQTLSYTDVDQELLFQFLDELTAEGYESVYVTSHFFYGTDAALVNAAKKYPIVKAFIQGDVHNDNLNGDIGGVPFFSDGHYSQSLMEYEGQNGDRIFDIQRLPLSYMIVEKRGDIELVDYYKEEMVYLGKDNYTFMEKYFTLTEVDAQGDNTLILTRITNTSVADGKTTNTIHAGYYQFAIRNDLSDSDRAIAERIAYLIEEYDVNVFDSRYETPYYEIPEGMENATETWYVDASGSFKLEGEARYWCYNYLGSFPNYQSFYKPHMVYKTYEIVDGGEATQIFVIESEVTWTEYAGPGASN